MRVIFTEDEMFLIHAFAAKAGDVFVNHLTIRRSAGLWIITFLKIITPFKQRFDVNTHIWNKYLPIIKDFIKEVGQR